MNTIDELQSLLDTHRKKAFFCCDETCFCWDVEKYLDDCTKFLIKLNNEMETSLSEFWKNEKDE